MEANSQAVRRPGAPTAARSCGSPVGRTCGHLPAASATVETQVKSHQLPIQGRQLPEPG